MENREKFIESESNSRVQIGIIPGHFATNHSHVNYYVDITSIKTSSKMAKEAGIELGTKYSDTAIDTVICMEGTEILGAFIAEYLSQAGINKGQDISVVTPELNAVNQMIFRDNTQGKIWGKKVLLLIASASTGKSIQRAVDCLQYYSGELVGISAIFSAISESNGKKVCSLFGPHDIPDYQNYLPSECPLCKSGRKVDALINSFGYSKL
ncbi:MAG: orotate phosphoribosyltransferase [Ruminococcus sp.]|nr:orotate phosphoribosyltransferase [Ruminococcus sp.]